MRTVGPGQTRFMQPLLWGDVRLDTMLIEDLLSCRDQACTDKVSVRHYGLRISKRVVLGC